MRRLAMLLTLVLVAACSAGQAQLPTVGGTDAPAGASAVAGSSAAAVPQPLAFTADLVDGGTFDGGEYAGQDLMIWFWAPW